MKLTSFTMDTLCNLTCNMHPSPSHAYNGEQLLLMLNDSRDEISVEVDNGTDKVVPHDTLSDGLPVEV